MPSHIHHLIAVLAVVVFHALPCGAQSAGSGIQIHPACRSAFYIFDSREGRTGDIKVYVNGKLSENVFELPTTPDKNTSIYEVVIPDEENLEFTVVLKENNTNIAEQTIRFEKNKNPCRWPQPCIFKMSPARVIEGGTLTITGTNLGTKNTDLTLYLRNNYRITSERITAPGNDTLQTAYFLIPTKTMAPDLYKDSSVWNTAVWAAVATNIGNKPSLFSNWKPVGLIRSEAKTWLFLICLGITLALLSCVYLLIRRCFETSRSPGQVFMSFLYDRKSNTYSLSKLQAFGWTVVVLWSYLFLALGKSVLAGDFVIPDLNPGILGLLGISYGGLLTARGVGNAFPKNDIVANKPSWCDLFSENNEISLPRLQLFAFTLIGYLLFIVSSFRPDFFETGLPIIPDTLNGLFLVSQGGYIGGKLTGTSAVTHVLPRRVAAPFQIPITLYGKGFCDKTALLVQGLHEAMPTTFLNQNALRFSLPAGKPIDPGRKQVVVLPPTGSSYVIENALEVIKVEIRKTMTVDASGNDALDVDFSGIVLVGEPLTAHLGESPLAVAHVAGNRYTVTRPGGLPRGETIRIAAQDGSFAFETTVNGTATSDFEPVTLL